jgi:hypothetical protein
MLNFLRALFRSKADEERERLNAYLDNALSPEERRQFERALAGDPALQTTLDDLRLLKVNLSRLPRHRAPRSFALSAAVHGRRRPKPAAQLYPFMRGAVALTAFFLVLAVVMDLLTAGTGRDQMAMSAADSIPESESIALIEALPPTEPRMLEAPEMAATSEVKVETAVSAMAIEEEAAADSGVEFDEPAPTLTPDVDAAVETRRPSAAESAPPVEAPPDDQLYGGAYPGASPPIFPQPTPAPLASPTATVFAPLTLPLEPTPTPTLPPELTVFTSRNPWQTIQIVLGAILAATLALTLYLRRRL